MIPVSRVTYLHRLPLLKPDISLSFSLLLHPLESILLPFCFSAARQVQVAMCRPLYIYIYIYIYWLPRLCRLAAALLLWCRWTAPFLQHPLRCACDIYVSPIRSPLQDILLTFAPDDSFAGGTCRCMTTTELGSSPNDDDSGVQEQQASYTFLNLQTPPSSTLTGCHCPLCFFIH